MQGCRKVLAYFLLDKDEKLSDKNYHLAEGKADTTFCPVYSIGDNCK